MERYTALHKNPTISRPFVYAMLVGIRSDGDELLKVLAREQSGTQSTDEVQRSAFSAWSVARFNDAIKWLAKGGHIEADDSIGSAPYEMRTLSTTLEGRLAAESLAEKIDMEPVHVLNANARRLLAYLHAGTCRSEEGPSPSDPTRRP